MSGSGKYPKPPNGRGPVGREKRRAIKRHHNQHLRRNVKRELGPLQYR